MRFTNVSFLLRKDCSQVVANWTEIPLVIAYCSVVLYNKLSELHENVDLTSFSCSVTIYIKENICLMGVAI